MDKEYSEVNQELAEIIEGFMVQVPEDDDWASNDMAETILEAGLTGKCMSLPQLDRNGALLSACPWRCGVREASRTVLA